MTLYIIRGLPGSGKTTLARILCPEANHAADDYFTNKSGEYLFLPELLKEAHRTCQDNVRESMRRGLNVAVHNTFSQPWEAKVYFDMAKTFGYSVNVIECQNTFENTHNVPEANIEAMRKRWKPLH